MQNPNALEKQTMKQANKHDLKQIKLLGFTKEMMHGKEGLPCPTEIDKTKLPWKLQDTTRHVSDRLLILQLEDMQIPDRLLILQLEDMQILVNHMHLDCILIEKQAKWNAACFSIDCQERTLLDNALGSSIYSKLHVQTFNAIQQPLNLAYITQPSMPQNISQDRRHSFFAQSIVE